MRYLHAWTKIIKGLPLSHSFEIKLKKKKDSYSRNAALSPCPNRILQRTFGVYFYIKFLFIGYIAILLINGLGFFVL